MTAVIDIRGLHKHFGHVRALAGLDLAVEDDEIHGFLGPNGAGKTTTIRVLLGTLRATSGHVSLLGRDPWADAVDLHREIAYVPGDVTLWPSLTGGEIIDLLARMHGGIDEARRAELIQRFDFDPTKKARTYSKGNRQKVSLVSALSSRARLLLLDEPSSGLDPLMENIFRECVTEARDRGATGAAVQPHFGRDGSLMRESHDHPRGQDGGDRISGIDATPQPNLDKGRDAQRSRRSQQNQGCRGYQLRRPHPPRSGRQ
jgi:ABC-2 type transport system ATP-binding protein